MCIAGYFLNFSFKLSDIFKLQQLKCYYKLIKGDLPKYVQHFSYIHNFLIHHHYTRETSSIFIPRVNHAYAQKHIRHYLQTINTPNIIIVKTHSHTCSLRGFLKSLFLVITKITDMFQIVIYANLEIVILLYMLRIILLLYDYTIDYVLMICNK